MAITLGLGCTAGVLAGAAAYYELGWVAALAVAVPAAALLLWLRRYLTKTRASVAQLERSNTELRRSNAELGELYEFGSELPGHEISTATT